MFQAAGFLSWHNDMAYIELIDDDFGRVRAYSPGIYGRFLETSVAIITEYSKRKLDIGLNLAMFIIWNYDIFRNSNSIDGLKQWQNDVCPKYASDWPEIAASRDRWLKKLMVWG